MARGARVSLAMHEVPVRATLEVDTNEVGEEGPALARRVNERGKAMLLEEEVLPGRSADDPVIKVVIVPGPDPEEPGFIIGFSIERGPKVLEGSSAQTECELCTEGEVVAKVIARLPELIAQVKADVEGLHQQDHEAEAVPVPDGETTEPKGEGKHERGRLEPIGISGIAIGVGGLVLTGAGIGLAVRPDRVVGDDGAVERATTKPPGYALIGVGSAMLVTGVALIVVDRLRAKRKASPSGAALRPGVMWADGPGVTLTGRF